MIYCCKEHAEFALEEVINETGEPPKKSMWKSYQQENVDTVDKLRNILWRTNIPTQNVDTDCEYVDNFCGKLVRKLYISCKYDVYKQIFKAENDEKI